MAKFLRRKVKFLIRQVEAWPEVELGWTYNNVWNVGRIITRAKNEGKAITAYLKRKGITFYRGRTRIEFDGDNYTIVDRKTGEPLFDAVYEGETFS